MRPQDLASVVRGAHTLTPAIKCCLRHMPALALRRYAIPLKTYACAKSPILQKNIPCNCNKLRPFVFAARGAYPDALVNLRRTTFCTVLPTIAHGACPFLSSTKRAMRIGKIILPHSYKSENAKKKSTCPAKHTNGILTRPATLAGNLRPTHTLSALHTTHLVRCAPPFYGTEPKSPQGKLPVNKQSAQKERLRTVAARSLGVLGNTRRGYFCAVLPTAQDSGAEKQQHEQELSNADATGHYIEY